MIANNAAHKQRGKPFPKGRSGNPAGRPKGARNPALAALDAIGEAGAQGVLQATVKAAQGGDMVAARIVLDRIWPARKGRPVALDLPEVATSEGVTAAMAAVIEAMAHGTLSPDEASAIASVIEGQRRAIETIELEGRIAALEEKHGQPE